MFLVRPSKRSSPESGDLRRRILDASIDLVRTEGLASLSMREVARRAGVSHQAPYHHFPDRESILAAIAEEGFSLLKAGMSEASARATDPRDKLIRCGTAYVEFALANPAHFRMMFRPELVDFMRFPPCMEAGDSAFQQLLNLVNEVVDATGGDKSRMESWVALLWSVTHGLSGLYIDGPMRTKVHSSVDQAAGVRAVLELFADIVFRTGA